VNKKDERNTQNDKKAGENGVSVGGHFADGRTLMGLTLKSCIQHKNANVGTVDIVSFHASGSANPGSMLTYYTWEGWLLGSDVQTIISCYIPILLAH